MIWMKRGAQLVKQGLFWICNKGVEALFWWDSCDGFPPILSQFPHLQALSTTFFDAGWSRVEDFKITLRLGQGEVVRWKEPHEWPPRGFVEDREDLAKILNGRMFNLYKE